MSAVSGEDTQDRTDRAILTPWLKFLWESYRQCLDLLRNNALLEKLYQEVAQNGMLGILLTLVNNIVRIKTSFVTIMSWYTVNLFFLSNELFAFMKLVLLEISLTVSESKMCAILVLYFIGDCDTGNLVGSEELM